MIFMDTTQNGIWFEVYGEQHKLYLDKDGNINLTSELGDENTENRKVVWNDICEAIKKGCLRNLSE